MWRKYFLVLLFAVLSSNLHADFYYISPPISLHHMAGTPGIRFYIRSDQEAQYGGNHGYSTLLHFDPAVFSNPRISPPLDTTWVHAGGAEVHPGYFRFYEQPDPCKLLVTNGTDVSTGPNEASAGNEVLAVIELNVNPAAVGTSTLTFSRLKITDEEGNLNSGTNFSFGPVTVKVNINAAQGWSLYE
jgi:hypothetical protein